jgi:hypothetical protein
MNHLSGQKLHAASNGNPMRRSTMLSATHARNLSVVIPRPIPWYALLDAGGLGSCFVPKSQGP